MFQQTSTIDPLLIIGGSLAFVTSMAWNNAFQSLFEKYLGSANAIYAKFIYAAILTVVAIILITISAKIYVYSAHAIAERGAFWPPKLPQIGP
jgi:multisubunit Na+/H+ antiporter MnhB subunit